MRRSRMDSSEYELVDYLPGMRPRRRVRNLVVGVIYLVFSPVIAIGMAVFTLYVYVVARVGRGDVPVIGGWSGGTGTGTGLNPMIGHLAVVMVTTILAAGVAGAFMFGFVQLPVTNAPQAAFSFDQTGPATLEITHQTGDQLDPATLTVRVDGDPVAGSWQPTPVTSGSSYRVTGVGSGATVVVVYTDAEGWSATLASHEVGQ